MQRSRQPLHLSLLIHNDKLNEMEYPITLNTSQKITNFLYRIINTERERDAERQQRQESSFLTGGTVEVTSKFCFWCRDGGGSKSISHVMSIIRKLISISLAQAWFFPFSVLLGSARISSIAANGELYIQPVQRTSSLLLFACAQQASWPGSTQGFSHLATGTLQL